MANIVIATENDFDEILKSADTALVDFYATWCPPCKMLVPVLEKVAKKLDEKYLIIKVNVDECEKIAQRFGIMSVPTMVFFYQGDERKRLVGYRQEKEIIDTITHLD
jgi:thioredoxin 1